METYLGNFLTDLIGRIDGPMHFRLYLQPMMAIAFAVRDGLKDAHEGRPPYGWSLLTDAEHRAYLLKDGWKGISRVFVLAYVLDVVYQFFALGGLRPLQALFTALLLAIVPYLLLRGPANRVMHARAGRHGSA